MKMGKGSAEAKDQEAVPEHLRCSRTDGKNRWRCPRRVVGNMKRCEFHRLKSRQYEQKRRNNNHIAAADSKNANQMKKKKPKLSSDGNHVNDMEGEGCGSTTVDITGYDLKNRICKLKKLIAKLKAAKLASKA